MVLESMDRVSLRISRLSWGREGGLDCVGLGADDVPVDEVADEYRPGDSVLRDGSEGRDKSCRDEEHGEGGTASPAGFGATIVLVLGDGQVEMVNPTSGWNGWTRVTDLETRASRQGSSLRGAPPPNTSSMWKK